MSEQDPPKKQGVVTAIIQPIVFKDPKTGEATVGAIGVALDEHGNPIDQTAEREAAMREEQAKP